MSRELESARISVTPDGAARFIYHDDLRPLLAAGAASIRRASHVEPTADGLWTADLGPCGGPVLGPFEERTAALAAERQWIEDNIL